MTPGSREKVDICLQHLAFLTCCQEVVLRKMIPGLIEADQLCELFGEWLWLKEKDLAWHAEGPAAGLIPDVSI